MEENGMDVCYNKLFKLLIDKSLRKTKFAKAVGISRNTLAKLSKNQNVSLEVIAKIYRFLDCSVDDILNIVPQKDK